MTRKKSSLRASSPFGQYREKYTRERHARGDATAGGGVLSPAPRGFAARSRVRSPKLRFARLESLLAGYKKSSDFHGGIQFQSSFTIRWELKDKNFHKIDIICLDDSLKYQIMALKTNENFIPFSNSVTVRKPRGTDLVTASELIPGFCRSKSNFPIPGSLRTIKSPTLGIVSGIKSPPLARTPPSRDLH